MSFATMPRAGVARLAAATLSRATRSSQPCLTASARAAFPRRPFAIRAAQSMEDIQNTVSEADDKLVVIEWKATWCSKCKILAKELERLSAANPDVEFLFADIDDIQEGKQHAGVEHLPTMHFIKSGELVHAITGVRINEVTKTIEQYKGTERDTSAN